MLVSRQKRSLAAATALQIRAGRAPNVSSYMARLIEDASATETFEEMMAAWIHDSGASRDEIAAAHVESHRATASFTCGVASRLVPTADRQQVHRIAVAVIARLGHFSRDRRKPSIAVLDTRFPLPQIVSPHVFHLLSV